MTANRQEIRQDMLDQDLVDGVQFGTATGGASGTLIDTTLLQVGGNSVSKFASRYLYRPVAANTADVFRRVAPIGYDPATGVLTHGGPGYTEAPKASTDNGYYELWFTDPAKVNRAFSRALTTQCYSLQFDEVTTDGSTLYDITTSPFSLTDIVSIQNQVLELVQVSGSGSTSKIVPWTRGGRTWHPETDDGTLNIRFSPAPTGTIAVIWKKPFADITDETTDTEADTDFVTWATFYELFSALEREAIADSESDAGWTQLKNFAYQRFWARRQMVLDRFASQYHIARPRWRSATGSPRMGRFGGRLGGYGSITV